MVLITFEKVLIDFAQDPSGELVTKENKKKERKSDLYKH